MTMQVTVGPIDWGASHGTPIETVIAVMLRQSRRNSSRRMPSRGDAGVDVFDPVAGGYEVIQIKGFAGPLTPSRKRQIAESLQSVLDDPELDAPVVQWRLVAPTLLSKEGERWFRELTEGTPFPCRWEGLDFVNALAAENAHVIDYYFRDGKARLESNLRDLSHATEVLDRPDTPLRPGELEQPLAKLLEAVNRDDPHFWYDFELTREMPASDTELRRTDIVLARSQPLDSGGFLTIRVREKYQDSLDDRPITVGFTLDPSAGPQLEESLGFGAPTHLTGEVLRQVVLDAPAGLGFKSSGGDFRLLPAEDPSFRPYRLRLRVIDAAGQQLAETLLHVHSRRAGRLGTDLDAEDAGGAFGVRLRLTSDGEAGQLRLNFGGRPHVGRPVSAVLPGIRLAANLRHPHRLQLLPEFGHQALVTMPIVADLDMAEPGYDLLIEALDVLQRITPATLTVPECLSTEEMQAIRSSARMINGEVVSGKWNEFSAEITAVGLPAALDAMAPLGRLMIVASTTVSFAGQTVELGQVEMIFMEARVDDPQSLLAVAATLADDSTVTVPIVPGRDRTFQRRLVALQS